MTSFSREELRSQFITSWKKYRQHLPLTLLENEIVANIIAHPEYHAFFEHQDALIQDFPADSLMNNPFLHLSLHMSINEQTRLDRPKGIAELYQKLLTKSSSPHSLQHQMMECLAECLWQAQFLLEIPDEMVYLRSLRQLNVGLIHTQSE